MEEKEKKIKEIIETLKPYLINDGGNIEFVKLEDDIVYVRLLGTCSHCPMMEITLKDGIEAVIMEEIPDIKKVENIE